MYDLGELFRMSYERDKDKFQLLNQHGWYPGMEVSFGPINKAYNRIQSGNLSAANEILVEYYETELDSILDKVPQRRLTILEKCFIAHRQKDYELSIPVMLAQIDGLCKDKFDGELFQGNNKEPRCASHTTKTDYSDIINRPLKEKTNINFNGKERGHAFNDINRHMILHGEDCGYGTQVNACKVISLLDLVLSAESTFSKVGEPGSAHGL